MRWFASTPLIRAAIQLAHNQSENPMAQMSDGPPPQTSHVESEQTTSVRLRKLPMQPNTRNIFVPDLTRVSPNASDVQRLGRCVPAFISQCSYLLSKEQGHMRAAFTNINAFWIELVLLLKTVEGSLQPLMNLTISLIGRASTITM